MSWTSRREEILEEHASIRATIRRVQMELVRLTEGPARPGKAGELPGLVRRLREQLNRHFELEESGGLLGAASEYYDPDMQREVADLVAEHRGFQLQTDRIVEELARGSTPEGTVLSYVDADLHDLIASLARHEATESALLGRLVAKEAEA